MSPTPESGAPARAAQRLFLLGFFTLFLELLLIRYLAGSIWNLGFFPNLVLLGAFVGMGTGFVCHPLLAERASRALFGAVPLALLGLVGFVHFLHPSVPGFESVSGEIGGEVFFTSTADHARTNYALFALWLFGVIAIFAMISQYTAKLFARFRPLRAYTLDIAGSCCGIVAFMAISWLELRAALWFAACIPLVIAADGWPSARRAGIAAAALLGCAGLVQLQDTRLLSDPDFAGALEVRWSPYQKVELARAEGADPFVFVNGVKHQAMHRAEDLRRIFYQLPHDHRREHSDAGPYRRVLVIGAGSGNDVASALMNGAREVEAVEIDPVIAELGRRHHPARPYQDARVELVIADGREHLTRGEGHYDLIVFALTDSLVKVSPMAQLRLENYIFTVESLRRGFELLSPDGALVLYNYYREPWVLEKLELALREATGREPRRLIDNRLFALLTLDRRSPPARAAAGPPGIEPSRDDWPFPYLRRRDLPPIYLGAMALLLAYGAGVFLLVQRRLRRGAGVAAAAIPLSLKLAFALMGAAFLLLETKSIIQFSLLFGTTWLNNSLVFLGVLLLVLAANWTAQVVRGRWLWWAVLPLLLASSLAPLFYPLANLLYLEHEGLRFAAASLLTFSPVFFANLLFSLAFRDQHTAEHLFGWNLFGATLGGVLEYSSMAIGYGALAVVVALCYAAAFALLARGGALRAEPGAPDR
jgi:hypothetical protein